MNILRINNRILKKNGILLKPESPFPYRTVVIGTQEWMAEDLREDDGQGGIGHMNLTVNGVNLGERYWYNGYAALRIGSIYPGWHLPTEAEWETLINYVGPSTARQQLGSVNAWDSGVVNYDTYGFTAYPVGYLNNSTDNWVDQAGVQVSFWTSTVDGNDLFKCQFHKDNPGRDTAWMTDPLSPYCNVIRLIKD